MLERPYYNLLHFNSKLMFLVRVYIAVSTASFVLNIGTRHIARCIFVQMDLAGTQIWLMELLL